MTHKRKRKTAGELSLQAASDTTKYNSVEVGHALTDDVVKQLYICAQNHESMFDEEEYFVVLIKAKDPLIQGIERHKYYAYLHMPSPRPEQSCYLYNKKTQKMKRLWSLPPAKAMAELSEATYVLPIWQLTKGWCDAFFKFRFWEHIRDQHNITHLSEHEYLKANREKLIQAGCQEAGPVSSDAFDFSKVSINQIIDTKTAVAN